MDFETIKARYLETLRYKKGISGRATRTEFWNFQFANFVIFFVLDSIIRIVGNSVLLGSLFQIAVIVFAIYILLPAISVVIRRLHDIDKSGWWLLITLVPVIGWITLVVFYCIEGTRGTNRFGEQVKA